MSGHPGPGGQLQAQEIKEENQSPDGYQRKMKSKISNTFKSNEMNPIKMSSNRQDSLENKYLSDRSGKRPSSSKID